MSKTLKPRNVEVGDILERHWFSGKKFEPKRFCPRCGTSGPHIDWSRRVFVGVEKELEPVAPCECAKHHRGRWLRRHPRDSYEILVLESMPEGYEPYMNEYFFPLPETTCECDFCENFNAVNMELHS